MRGNAQRRRSSRDGCIEHVVQQLAMIHDRYTGAIVFGITSHPLDRTTSCRRLPPDGRAPCQLGPRPRPYCGRDAARLPLIGPTRRNPLPRAAIAAGLTMPSRVFE